MLFPPYLSILGAFSPKIGWGGPPIFERVIEGFLNMAGFPEFFPQELPRGKL